MKHVDEKYLIDIRRRVVIRAGFGIKTKQDCRVLSELIHEDLGETLSESTIYRLFLLKEDRHFFYKTTYNILSRFIGFVSWDDYCIQRSYNEEASGLSMLNAFSYEEPGLLDFVIRNEAWNIAKDFFDAVSTTQREESLQVVGWSIYLALKRNPDKERLFYELFAGHAAVRKAFFEFCADPDFLLPNYKFGYECYLKNMPSTVSTDYWRDYIFANSFLIRRLFIEGDLNGLVVRFENCFLKEFDRTLLNEVKPIYPVARFFQAKLLYRHVKSDLISVVECFHLFIDWMHQYWPKLSLSERKSLLYCATEAAQMTKTIDVIYPTLCKEFRPFINVLFGEGSTPSSKAMLERTEFNGVRLQHYVRE